MDDSYSTSTAIRVSAMKGIAALFAVGDIVSVSQITTGPSATFLLWRDGINGLRACIDPNYRPVDVPFQTAEERKYGIDTLERLP